MPEDIRARPNVTIVGTIDDIQPGDTVTIVRTRGGVPVILRTITMPTGIPGFVRGKAEVSMHFVLGFDTSLMTATQKAAFLGKISDGTLLQTEETSGSGP